MSKTILVTGAAGFIGSHLSRRLLERGDTVVGIDNLNDYYDVRLKEARLTQRLESFENFTFKKLDLADKAGMDALFQQNHFDAVVNLAAQAGVRYSLTNPQAYIDANIVGFLNILENCRHHHIGHLAYASSSSVYGFNTHMPFSVEDSVDHPVSLYAASKKSNELMAHAYSHLFDLPTTGLRFFTVYGPWGRPDMAMFLFADAMLKGEAIKVFNHGNMQRDFTYIDDIIEGVVRVVDNPAQPNPTWTGDRPDPASSKAPWRVYNIGRGQPVELMHMISCMESELGMEAKKEFMDMQPGDVPATWADTTALERDLGYRPQTTVEEGVQRFIRWYLDYYQTQTP